MNRASPQMWFAANEGVFFLVNKDNDVGNITAVHLNQIVRLEMKKWPNGKAIVVVLHRNSSGEAETLEHLAILQ